MRRERIYVCHTYYHVYVACLKELNLAEEAKGGATLLLSSMSTDFGDLLQRAKQSGIFEDVLSYDEKSFEFFPELTELKRDRGSLLLNMRQRIRFERRLGQLEEQFVPVDFAEYKDRYVFCDSDPIGYYLAYKKLPYHALEDGLNCLRYRDTAREDNAGHFGFKAKLAALGLIFIQNGYSRWCVDMEVKGQGDAGPAFYPRQGEDCRRGSEGARERSSGNPDSDRAAVQGSFGPQKAVFGHDRAVCLRGRKEGDRCDQAAPAGSSGLQEGISGRNCAGRAVSDGDFKLYGCAV